MDKTELQKLARAIWWITFALSIYLASTTGFMGYVAANQYGKIAQIGLAIVAVLLLDLYTTNWVQLSIRGLVSAKVRNAMGGWLWGSLLIVSFARFAGTTTVTYWSREPIAAAVTGDLDTDKETDAIQKANADKSGLVASLEKEKNSLRRSERDRVRDAEKAGKALLAEAINSEGENVAKLYLSGSAWVKTNRKFSKYRTRISEAKIQAAKLVSDEKARTQAASEAYLLAATSGNGTVKTLEQLLKEKAARYERIQNVYSASLGLFDVIAGFIVLLLSLFLAMFKVKHDIEYKSPFAAAFSKIGEKAGADSLSEVEAAGVALWGLFFLPFQAIRKIVSFTLALGRAGMYKVEKTFKLDINGDGIIGEPEEAKAQTPSTEPPTNPADLIPKVGRNQIGFSVNRSAQKVGENPPTSDDLKDVKSTDVGVSPTLPTFEPTFEKLGNANLPEKVGEYEQQNTDLPKRKIPTIQRRSTAIKSVDRANRSGEFDKLADALRAAWKKQYGTYPELLRQAKAAGFTVYTNGNTISITKPKPNKRK